MTEQVKTSGEIKVLSAIEAVRHRPEMYVGSTGEMGLNGLFYEVVDNSFNESLAGFAARIDVTIHTDNSITVVDDGRGIPVDEIVYLGRKVPFAELALTHLRCGRK